MTLHRGIKGQALAVQTLQARLNALGYRARLVVDGDFGPLTEGGVRWAQGRFRDPPGVVGPVTAFALENAAEPSIPAPGAGARIIAEAHKWYAADIRERPKGSNRGGPAPGQPEKYSVDAIHAPFFGDRSGLAWCAMFVWAVVDSAGIELPPKRDFWWPLVSHWRKWAKGEGCLYPARDFWPEPGTLFTTGNSHIGFVEKTLPGNMFASIEGNAGDRVRSISRPIVGKVTDYIRIGG